MQPAHRLDWVHYSVQPGGHQAAPILSLPALILSYSVSPLQHAMDAYHASGRTAQAVAECLLEQAQKRRSKDDVSVIAVVFGKSCL